MKRFILYTIGIILSLIFLALLSLLLILFFKPTVLINPGTLDLVLRNTNILKEWSWKDAEVNHEWIKWNKRNLRGHFYDLCIVYKSESADVRTCLEEVSWDFIATYNLGEGLQIESSDPFLVRSKESFITLKEVKEEEPEEKSPPDVWKYWKTLWSESIPEIDLAFEKIVLKTKDQTYDFDLKLIKQRNELNIYAQDFHLIANRKEFELTGPEHFSLPFDVPVSRPIYLRNLSLKGEVKESGIPLALSGALESLKFHFTSLIDLPIQQDPASVGFRKKILLATEGNLSLPQIKESLERYAPGPFTTLPAPFNVMNGDIKAHIAASDLKDADSVMITSSLNLDLKSDKQVFQMALGSDLPLNLETFSPGAILLAIDFKKVTLQLPRLSKKSLPPQFLPDSRIKTPEMKKHEQKQSQEESNKKNIDLSMNLEALGDKALQVRTNLLDEILRLNFDLEIREGELKDGFIQVLPLKTIVFKRPIQVSSLKILFEYPLDPVINATIVFPLPEYKITLNLEGPLSNPRHSFTSEPPLPQNDIYSVLLFGRPMSDLAADDKAAASRTNQLLSQGILSLSVLYFFAGSPVEYIGYDPETRGATAQIGLGSKSSVRVGRGAGGSTSTSVRRSLGKGWYLDTSVQNNSGIDTSRDQNYGVLLERIISY
jgi:hypothetical protein